jgi:hypothetical protein
VGGELGAQRPRIGAVQPLQRLGDPQVVGAAPRRAEREIGDLTDLVMSEVVGVGALLADDPAAPQLVQGADERVLIGAAGQSEQLGGELPADGGGHADQLAGGGGKARQSRLDHGLHLRAEPGRLGPIAGPARPHRLHHEQRVALGLVMEPVRGRSVERAAGQPLGQRRRLLPAEPGQLQLGHTLQRPQSRHQVVGRMRRVDLLPPGGGRHQQPRPWLQPQEIVEELQRLAVAPLQVVGNQQQRPLRREDARGEGIEQPPARIAVLRLQRVRPSLGPELEQQACQLRAIYPVDPRRGGPKRFRAQPCGHHPVGEAALGRICPRLGRRRPPVGAPQAELLDQAALANARFAGHQDELRASLLGLPPQVGQAGPLGRPAHQGRAAQRTDRAADVAGGCRVWWQRGLVGRARCRRGLNPELTLQDRRAGVVGTQRLCPVAARGVQPHEHLVGLLA